MAEESHVSRRAGNGVAVFLAVVVGALTVFASLKYLKEPQVGWNWGAVLDWSVLALSAVMTGTITFFITWGHFQEQM